MKLNEIFLLSGCQNMRDKNRIPEFITYFIKRK